MTRSLLSPRVGDALIPCTELKYISKRLKIERKNNNTATERPSGGKLTSRIHKIKLLRKTKHGGFSDANLSWSAASQHSVLAIISLIRVHIEHEFAACTVRLERLESINQALGGEGEHTLDQRREGQPCRIGGWCGWCGS